MKTVHIGHHFFGAGNIGDDFLLAGFLGELAAAGKSALLTCCVGGGRDDLARRFPGVRWEAGDEAGRERCIRECDLWLGLGGAPWQSAVSDWFIRHLEGEHRLCRAARRPMFFLGVGGQDRSAYADPVLRRVAAGAEGIWTRDSSTAEALAAILPPGKVRAASDPSHLFFAANPPPPPAPGRLTAVLNFEYAGWAGLESALGALDRLNPRERVWLAQESRPLPGAEHLLYRRLPPGEQPRWRLHPADLPGRPLPEVLSRWPSGQWLLSSRHHATLAGAWAGSKAVVLETNEKLRAAAAECGYPLFPLGRDPLELASLLEGAEAPPPARLRARAELARRACREFFEIAGL